MRDIVSPDIFTLRPPSRLEALFYRELLAPIQEFTAARLHDPDGRQATHQLAQRFKKDIARYGYVLTEWGAMLQVEPDILDVELPPASKARVDLDMQILHRLTSK